ncbi:YolD-like family protein [Paenibacillus sp. D2_2]|uniref:YolD-like family protein n=1 Tax=Paenibacillus sp. D2_2 TaxID=3073092 RepID=UPI0028158E43|nr:YolD-like family protein [Paenibacillus sp. D2_2]WMT42572.1 YolD-like family protein [Paenibacillus sp. D2_2]
MTGKLQGNGMWESSRMMLPEHKEAILRSNRHLQKRTRVQLDEQELERVSRILMESLHEGREIALRLFGEYEDRGLYGTVTRLDLAGGGFVYRQIMEWSGCYGVILLAPNSQQNIRVIKKVW